ncbi:MAG: hypothetical protein STSR0008_16830 [Ignavibacterium sp.]
MSYTGELLALITAFLWSITSFLFGEVTEKIGPINLNINRLILGTMFLLIYILLFHLEIKVSFTQLIYLSISGIIGLVIGDSFLYKAFQHIGPRYSMLIMSLSPGLTSIFGNIFLKESLTFTAVIGIVITIAGISIVSLERKEVPTSKYKISKIGFLFAFLAALGQAIQLIFAKFAFNESEINGFVVSFIRMLSAFIIIIPAMAFIKKFKNPFKLLAHNSKTISFLVIGSFLGPFLGITFSLISISLTKVGIASTLMSTMPIIMLPMSGIIYKEKIPIFGIIGSILAVIGVAILFLR